MLKAQKIAAIAALCLASCLVSTATSAETPLTSDRTPPSPQPAAPAIAAPDAAPTPPEAASEVADAESLDCPPGQFPSAFSDVPPFHWAYQAVSNLASRPMQCFDLPAN